MKHRRSQTTRFTLSLVVAAVTVLAPSVVQAQAPEPAPPASSPPAATPPAGGEPAPADAPAPATPEPATPEPPGDADAKGGVPPATPSLALLFLESRRQAAAARANPPPADAVQEPDDGSLGNHQDHWIAFLGVRTAKIKSAGFDPFADSDELVQLSVGAGRTLVSVGRLSLAGLFLYDGGARAGKARGADSEVTVHRLTLGAEGRYHVLRQLFVFGRVAPGVIHSVASLEDPVASLDSREARHWVFATDLSLGAMLELSGWSGTSRGRRPSVWLGLDGGYGFAGESELSLVPGKASDGPERGQPVDLGPLALNGPFLRGSISLTY